MIAKRRYSPLYILFEWGSIIRNGAIIALYLFIINQSDGMVVTTFRWIFIGVLPIMLVWAIMNWFVERYEMNEKAFILYRGVWKKSEQTIPLYKVQNIHSKRNVLHRLFKVTALTLETAASGENDTIKFKVISEKEAEKIQTSLQLLRTEKSNKADQADETSIEGLEDQQEGYMEEPLADRTVHYVPTKKDLIYASFTSFNFLIIVPIVLVAYRVIENFFQIDEYVAKWFGGLTLSWVFIVFIIVVLLLISSAIGIIWTYLTYGNYEIASDEKTIYIRKGIWEESQLTIQKHRVQGIRFEQSFMKRLLRLTEVRLLMIQDEDSEVSSLYPFLPASRAEEIVREILPTYIPEEETERLSPQAFYVRCVTTTIFSLAITIPLWVYRPTIFGQDWISLWLGPALFGIIIIYRYLAYRQTKFIVHGDMIQWRTAGLGTQRFLTKRKQIIEASNDRGPFQRLFGLRSITIMNRGKPVEETTLSDIKAAEAMEIFTWYYERKVDIVRIDESYIPSTTIEERLENER